MATQCPAHHFYTSQHLHLLEALRNVTERLPNQQNGSIADALSLFKTNASRHFEGVEACAICYSVVSVTDRSMPTKRCRTCKQVSSHSSAISQRSYANSHMSAFPPELFIQVVCNLPWIKVSLGLPESVETKLILSSLSAARFADHSFKGGAAWALLCFTLETCHNMNMQVAKIELALLYIVAIEPRLQQNALDVLIYATYRL